MKRFDGMINYVARTGVRPRYYANDHARDVIALDVQPMTIMDARDLSPSLDVEGFALVSHKSEVAEFADPAIEWDMYRSEMAGLIRSLSGADAVIVNAPGILRFSEKSGRAGALNNSMPARFVHVDISDATAEVFAMRPAPEGKPVRRYVHFNVWRAISSPPQDVPLAICDARSVALGDLIEADAVFDEAGKPEWSFESWVVAHNPAHRWYWFSDMTRDEALVFKTNDSDASAPHCVPHVAFDNPDCPEDAPPRVSVEMRAIAFWHD